MPLEYALQFRGRFSEPSPWKIPRSFNARLTSELGVKFIPDQIIRASKRHPYGLNLMVVGEAGLGKTTFLNTLFSTNLKEHSSHSPQPESGKTVAIKPTTYELVEKDITLLLTVIDTPGFGDSLDRSSDLDSILEYIDAQYHNYLNLELKAGTRMASDPRVHAVLYFLRPTGAGLRDLDIMAMRQLSDKANVIPIIAKSDSLTADEVQEMKKRVLLDLQRYDIKTYPQSWTEDQETLNDIGGLPFAIMGSNEFVETSGKKVRGRSYRWGVVEVENPSHCDFTALRTMLMTNSLLDILDTTHHTHYATFRASSLNSAGHRRESFLACDDAYDTRIVEARSRMQEEMQRREDEMRQSFVLRVREKEAALREKEEELQRMRQKMMSEGEELKKANEQLMAECDEAGRNFKK